MTSLRATYKISLHEAHEIQNIFMWSTTNGIDSFNARQRNLYIKLGRLHDFFLTSNFFDFFPSLSLVCFGHPITLLHNVDKGIVNIMKVYIEGPTSN